MRFEKCGAYLQFCGAIFIYLHHDLHHKLEDPIYMEKVTIFLRTTKTEGTVKLRFRLREGREVDLYHKSQIKADLKDLAKFDEYGNVKPKVSVINKELKLAIDIEMDAMHTAYAKLCENMQKSNINGELFEDAIQSILDPEVNKANKAQMTMLDRFERFINDGYRDGIFGEGRMRHYKVVHGDLERFLAIKNLRNITPTEFTADMLMDLRYFFTNEYEVVEKYSYLYDDKKERDIPRQPRDMNTTITKLKKIQAFFNELEDKEEIIASPFRKLGKKRKASVLKERYDEPIFLYKEELLKVLATEVPEKLIEAKECFLLQCAFGCRIADFQALSMDKIKVSKEGIPYIHYLPKKTLRDNLDNEEVETPIVKYALELIKKWQFNFHILKYVTGKSGYNAKIKQVLEFCGIDRECKEFDNTINDNVYKPLYVYGSSKLCRKTHVDMMAKVQVDLYASGLHKQGSKAVNRYTKMELKDHFTLMCAAFDQPFYKVDKKLNIIEE